MSGTVMLPDWQGLGRQVRVAMAEDNLSYRQAAEVIGTDQATLHRLAKHGKEPSATTYLRVMHCLEARILSGDPS
jgi:hypothetical protein